MVPKSTPKTLVVIGSGAIGMEFASFYRALGADVTVVEALPRILPVEDEEVSKAAQKAFEKRGMKFRVGGTVKKLAKTQGRRQRRDRGRRQGRDPRGRRLHRRRRHHRQHRRTSVWRRWA